MTNTGQIHSSNMYYSSTQASTCPRFLVGVFVHSTNTCPHVLQRVFAQGTNTCPMFWGGYSSKGRILAPCVGEGIGEGIRPWDEYLPHFLERVFVHGRILASCCGDGIRPRTDTCLMIWRWYSSTDEYLPLVVERVFVRSRRIVWSTPCEYCSCGDVKMIPGIIYTSTAAILVGYRESTRSVVSSAA